MTPTPSASSRRRPFGRSISASGRRSLLAASAALLTALALTTAPRPIGPELSYAHTIVKSKRPGNGATAPLETSTVAVVFGGSVKSAQLVVTGPGAKRVSGATKRDKASSRRFFTTLSKGLKPGSYRAKLTFTGTDGHSQSITWPFRLKG